jgi:N4-gp56 family major capsid protein
MPVGSYASISQRVGTLKGEILSHAAPHQVLNLVGTDKDKVIEKNKSNNVKFRRWLPYGGVDNQWITASNVGTFASSQQAVEGVTPTADTLTPQDVTATLVQYIVMYCVTDQLMDMHEDGAVIPDEAKLQAGQRMGLIGEMVRYGAYKAGTNVFYSGGTSRATVANTITLPLLRRVTKSLKSNYADMITRVIAPSTSFATAPIEPSYVCFASTDLEPAIRDLPGFKTTTEYANRKIIHERELGSCQEFRFITSNQLVGYPDSGAAVGSTGMISTTGTLIDVYPMIMMGDACVGQTHLGGVENWTANWLPPSATDKSDPGGQRGYVVAKWYYTAIIQNQGRMAVVEAGTPVLQ